jgi:NAD(P)H-hydrate epimerase
MQQIEREANASGLTYEQMMENAGSGLAALIDSAYSQYREQGVLALVGSGNNGGDALVALDTLAARGWKTTAYLVRPRPEQDPLLARLKTSGGGQIGPVNSGLVRLETLLRENTVLLDGVLVPGYACH